MVVVAVIVVVVAVVFVGDEGSVWIGGTPFAFFK